MARKKSAKKKAARKKTPAPDRPPAPAQASVAEAAEREAVYALLERRRNGERLRPSETARIDRYEKRHRERLRAEAVSACTQLELCEWFDVSRKVLLEWEAKGAPTQGHGRGRTYNLPAFIRWWKDHTRSLAREPADKESPALERKRMAEARLAEIRLAEIESRLVDRLDVEADAAMYVQAVRRGLESFAEVLPPLVAGLKAPEIAAVIERRVSDLLTEFADQMRSLGEAS